MSNYTQITNSEELSKIIHTSDTQPFLLLKHSTRCPISTDAHQAYTKYLDANDSIPAYLILVVEDRPISLEFAELVGVQHESPQVFIVKSGKAFWHCSHGTISVQSISNAIEKLELTMNEEGK